jgi:hypothetical protein
VEAHATIRSLTPRARDKLSERLNLIIIEDTYIAGNQKTSLPPVNLNQLTSRKNKPINSLNQEDEKHIVYAIFLVIDPAEPATSNT